MWVNDPASSLWNFIRILVAEPLTAFTCIRPHKYETFQKKKKKTVSSLAQHREGTTKEVKVKSKRRGAQQ